MKKITLNFLSKSFITLLFLAVIGVSANVSAAARIASQSGDWGSTLTWGGSAVPTASDDVTITGLTVTVSTSSALAKSIIVQSSASVTGKLIIQAAGSLTASTAATPLTLKGGEVENAGTLSLTTTSVPLNYGVCISYTSCVASTLVTAGKYSGAGQLILNCSTSTNASAINFSQTDATPVFSVGGTYTLTIPDGRPLFNASAASGSVLIDGSGTITAGTIGTPATYGLIMVTANNAQITINPNVTLSTYSSGFATGRGPVYFHSVATTSLTNKGTINIQGSGFNGIVSTSTSSATLTNEGTINISGTFSESGIQQVPSNYFYINNTGTVSISGLATGVPALLATNATGYLTFTNNTNGILDINVGSTGTCTSTRSRIKNYGGTIKGSGLYNLRFEPSTGTISPGGNGIGKITIAQLQLLAATTDNLTGNCIMNVNGKTIAGTDFDQIVFSQATVNIANATLETTVGGGYTPADNDAISLLTVGTTRSGNFSTATLPSSYWAMDYATTSAAKVKFTVSTTATDYFRSLSSGTWSTNGTWESSYNNTNWVSAVATPTSSATSVSVLNGHTVTVDQNTTANALTINSGGTLTVNAGKQLTVSSTMSNSGTLNLLSSETNGTATILTPATISGSGATYNVQQFVSSTQTGVNGRNWYISSPLSAATSSTITTATGNGLVYYDGTTNWPSAPSTLVEMKGYIAKSPAQNTTINFTGGTLNTGDKSVLNLPLGFNLVGNPYASSVDFAQAVIASTNVTNSIWYRSKKLNSYNFHTYNVTGGVSVHDGSAIIAPMQAFWIKTTSATNTFGFTNNMRSHQDQSVVANRLMVPKVNTQPLLRLQVSNAANRDETVVYFNPNAQNNVDEYDSQKMFNNINNVPEIFTKNANTNLVINGMNAIPYETEIPIGFSTGEAGNFSISRTELKNFDTNTKIMLIDKLNPTTEFDLTDGQVYNFSADITSASTDRFSLLFRAPGSITDIENATKFSAYVFVNVANQIVINTPEKSSYTIYNGLGQLIENGRITSNNQTSNFKLAAGVYVVIVGNQSTRVIVK